MYDTCHYNTQGALVCGSKPAWTKPATERTVESTEGFANWIWGKKGAGKEEPQKGPRPAAIKVKKGVEPFSPSEPAPVNENFFAR